MESNFYLVAVAFLVLATMFVIFSGRRTRVKLYGQRWYEVNIPTCTVSRVRGKQLVCDKVPGMIVERTELHLKLQGRPPRAMGTIKKIDIESNKRITIHTSMQTITVIGGRRTKQEG